MLNALMTHCLGQKLQIKSSYFSKMVLYNSSNKLRLQYEPDNLVVNKVCFAK